MSLESTPCGYTSHLSCGFGVTTWISCHVCSPYTNILFHTSLQLQARSYLTTLNTTAVQCRWLWSRLSSLPLPPQRSSWAQSSKRSYRFSLRRLIKERQNDVKSPSGTWHVLLLKWKAVVLKICLRGLGTAIFVALYRNSAAVVLTLFRDLGRGVPLPTTT